MNTVNRCLFLLSHLILLFLATTATVAQEHGILREVYTGIEGLYVPDLTTHPSYPNQPTVTEIITDYFEAPRDVDEFYGQRMRGILTAPETGNYVFWIASDDYGELWLSSDESQENLQLIATVPGATGSREWDRHPASQQSAEIPLIAGQRYYISALMKEHTGGDHLAVRWRLPNGVIEEPIPASRVTPPTLSPPEILFQPGSVTVMEGRSATFRVEVSSYGATSYQWWKDGVPIPGATEPTYVHSPVLLGEDGKTFHVVVQNDLGSVSSEPTILSVVPDEAPPELVSIYNFGRRTVVLQFSEKVTPASAANPSNYSFDGGVLIEDAVLEEDGRTVRLATSTLTYDVVLRLTFGGISDLAATPNMVAPDTVVAFTPMAGAIRLNEGMASNGQTIADDLGNFQDWIELFNAGGEPVNLMGWGLSDDLDDPFKWEFPSGTILGPREYLLVWASGNDTTGTTRMSEIFSAGSSWSYYDYGIDLGTAWKEASYHDSRWDSGPAPLGYSSVENYETTRISYGRSGSDKHITTYFRKTFEIEDADLVEQLVFHLWVDDAAVVYLNGTEIIRENLPLGPIEFETLSVNGIGSRPEWKRVEVGPDGLVSGQNVLAVEVHQTAPTSSDLGFDMRLEAWVFEPVLHTNFAYSAGGEEIILTSWEGVQVDLLPAKAMDTDVSVGRSLADPSVWVDFAQPTPGAENAGPEGERLPEEVIFSETARTFTASFTLELSGAAGSQIIRYTTDGSVPGATSPIYDTPIQIHETTLVRARVFDGTGASGRIGSEQFLHLHTSLANRKSHLPQIVMDVAGQAMDPNAMERRAGYFHLFEVGADGTSDLSRVPDVATRQGLRWRGRSSLSFPKKPYAIEFWNEADDDKSIEVLGMAAESDWVLYSPYRYDRAYIRNSLMYDLSRDIGRWAPASRFVEVFFNADGGDLSAGDYVGVYAIVERIKQGSDRLGPDNVEPGSLPPDGPIDVHAPGPWTGGYIFKIDRADPDEYEWTTDQGRILVLSRPKLIDLDGGPHASRSDATESSRQAAYLRGYVQAFEDALQADLAGDFSTRNYLNYIERDSWVDHLLLNAFAKNVDALRLSAYYHKPQNEKIIAGPLWDFDRSLNSYDGRDDSWSTWNGTGDATRYFEYGWWQSLCADPDFAQAFYDRWAELRGGEFGDSQLSARIEAMGAEINQFSRWVGSAAVRDAQRWGENQPANGSYLNEIANIGNWALQRANWMDRRKFDGTLLPAPPVPNSVRDIAETGAITFRAADGSIYFARAGADPRGSGGVIAGELYQGPIIANAGTVITARVRAADGSWSTPTVVEGPSEAEATLLHYWSFNEQTLTPRFTIDGGALSVAPGPATAVEYDDEADFSGVNARMGEETGVHLRINDPLGATLAVDLPTTGYEQLTLSYETRRSGKGAGLQQLSYTVNGFDYIDWPSAIIVEDDVPSLEVFDFSGIPAANDNPDFGIRIAFAEGDGGDGGNNRFDNFTLEGQPLAGVNQPPEVVNAPGLIEELPGNSVVLNLTDIFTDANDDPLAYEATSSRPGVATIELSGETLQIETWAQGETEVVLSANDGTNPAVNITFRVLVYPEPFAVGSGTFTFDAWSSVQPAGSFPEHMLFLQSDQDDPTLETPLRFAYNIPPADASDPADADFPYAASSRTRINGLEDSGISFTNTGRGRDVGAALLALDTRGADSIDVTWTAETLATSERAYAIRLQYRTGFQGPWSDLLDGNGQPVEYVRSAGTGEAVIGPVRLPEDLSDLPYIQLQWKYHLISGDSGPRDSLRLDDIIVGGALPTDSYAGWLEREFPDPIDRTNPDISGPTADPTGEGVPNLLRYALDITRDQPALEQLPESSVEEGRLVLTFRRDPAKTDIAYIVEATSDLQTWTEILYDSRLQTGDNSNGEYNRVEDSQPIGEEETRFLRLKIEQL